MSRKLVVNIDDVTTIADVNGNQHGLTIFEERERKKGWIGTESMSCTFRVVRPGQRSPLFYAMHSSEEMGFVVSGAGRYDVSIGLKPRGAEVVESFPVREGDIMLAPEGHSDMRFEIFNSGLEDLKFVAFRARSHVVNLTRLDEARAVIDAYIEQRWRKESSNAAGYDFDGRVLSIFDRDFQMLITFDQFGTIWANGSPVAAAPQAAIESRVDQLMQLERIAREAFRASKIG